MEAILTMRKNKIGDLLDYKGWSIYKLAKKVGQPYHNIQRIVQSTQIPEGTQYKTLLLISQALGVSIDELEDKDSYWRDSP